MIGTRVYVGNGPDSVGPCLAKFLWHSAEGRELMLIGLQSSNPGPQGLLRQFWACSEFCSNLRGKVVWSRPANFKQNPCLTDSVRHEFCLKFVFRRIGCRCCRGWRADSFGSCFPVRHAGPQYNVFWLVVEESVGRGGLVPILIIL